MNKYCKFYLTLYYPDQIFYFACWPNLCYVAVVFPMQDKSSVPVMTSGMIVANINTTLKLGHSLVLF